MDTRTRWIVGLAAAGSALLAWRVWAMRTSEPGPADELIDLSDHAPSSGARDGSEADRGSTEAVRLDLSRAEESGLRPVVEFLTFLQQTRGDSSHLLFVRYDDLDGLAEAEGVSAAEFLTRLDQLGVVVSTN